MYSFKDKYLHMSLVDIKAIAFLFHFELLVFGCVERHRFESSFSCISSFISLFFRMGRDGVNMQVCVSSSLVSLSSLVFVCAALLT